MSSHSPRPKPRADLRCSGGAQGPREHETEVVLENHQSYPLKDMQNSDLEEIARLLDQLNAGRWHEQYLELQDDGDFILVSVEVERSMDARTIEFIRADIRKVLKAKVPSRESEYSWMGVIKKGGVVIDSLMGGCTGKLREI